MVTVSKHAVRRLKEHCGLNKRSAQRMADKAFTDGIRHSDTRGRLNKWVTSLYFYNRTADNRQGFYIRRKHSGDSDSDTAGFT